tara:strand:- start:16017 stop:16454 length:438 start_codon:yes stop_codon:yes gene_type:complete
MAVSIRDVSNTPRVIGDIRVRDTGNVVRTIEQIWIRDEANVSRKVYQRGVRLAASPAFANGSRYGAGPITSDTVTVSIAGGAAPYSHSWALISPSAGAVALNPTSATTAFRAGGELDAIFRDTVTDTNGLSATIDVPASFTRTDL